jgi:hypothetical protein
MFRILSSAFMRVPCVGSFATVAVLFALANPIRAQTIGQRLPPWTPGTLDIHRISTGKGDGVLFVLPDRTTLLADPAAAPMQAPRAPEQRPNASRTPGEWIARYVLAVVPEAEKEGLDYGLITHFHGDHMGGFFPDTATTPGGYKLSGITDVGHRIPIRTMIDRDWPDYNYPPGKMAEMQELIVENYRKFLSWQTRHGGMRVERFQPGRNDQIVLRKDAKKYPGFEIRNIAASGMIWTGKDSSTRALFPSLDTLPLQDLPSLENMCSIVFRLQYGSFKYFAGGDIPGIVPKGKPDWYDVETPVAGVALWSSGYISWIVSFVTAASRSRPRPLCSRRRPSSRQANIVSTSNSRMRLPLLGLS